MRHFTVRPHSCVRSLRSPWALALASLLLLSPRTSEAQLGRLKKMGADAIKDAAKDKLATDKKPATSASGAAAAAGANPSSKEPGLPKLDDDRIALVLAGLAPQVKAAEIRVAAAAVSATYNEKKQASEACVQKASQTADPMAMAASAQKNEARLTALQNQIEPMRRRLDAASKLNDLRRLLFLQDSITVLSMRQAGLTMGVNCVFEFAPPALIESWVLERQGRSNADNGQFDPGDATREALTRTEYGIIRERIALWAMLQNDPALKGKGKEGVFTAEEQEALTKHAAEIAKLAPLFKSDALMWKGWSDLRDW